MGTDSGIWPSARLPRYFDFGIFGEPGDGAVDILFGGPNGLTATGSQVIHRPFELIRALPVETGNNFGAALAAGDFQHDGFSDLAVGVPNQTFILFAGSPFAIKHLNAGVVEVYNG